MSRQPIKIKVDVTKLRKELFFRAQSGAIYCDLVAWPVKDSRFGETHAVQQQRPKGSDEKMPFVGNLTLPDDGQPASRPADRQGRATTPGRAEPEEDDDPLPF